MADNFTPLNLDKVKDKGNNTSTFLLGTLVMLSLILAGLLFMLIMKKMNVHY